MKIYFVTRTYIMDDKVVNCANIRNRYVELLKERYNVIVVTPNYLDDIVKTGNGFICIPYSARSIDRYAERAGIYEDYLDSWTRKCIDYLKDVVTNEDIVFATSGGELACIKIADALKRKKGCKTIINFHDPINYTIINGKKTGGKYRNLHISRDKLAQKYIQTTDYIITSSDSYRKILENIYPNKKGQITNIYFGFINKANIQNRCKKVHKAIKMIYAGYMGIAQRAELIMRIWGNCEDVAIEYIGDASDKVKKMARRYPNVTLLPSMQHENFLQYMEKEADIGLVSLVGEEWGACVPSKIYDLINLEIPILAILPEGDAKDLINNGYGYAAGINEVEKHQENLLKIKSPKRYMEIVDNMRGKKRQWHMDVLFKEVYEVIEKVITMNDSF